MKLFLKYKSFKQFLRTVSSCLVGFSKVSASKSRFLFSCYLARHLKMFTRLSSLVLDTKSERLDRWEIWPTCPDSETSSDRPGTNPCLSKWPFAIRRKFFLLELEETASAWGLATADCGVDGRPSSPWPPPSTETTLRGGLWPECRAKLSSNRSEMEIVWALQSNCVTLTTYLTNFAKCFHYWKNLK